MQRPPCASWGSCACARTSLMYSSFCPRLRLPWGLKYFGGSVWSLSLSLPLRATIPIIPRPPSLFKHISTLLSPRKAKKLRRHGDSLPVWGRNVWLGGATAIFTAGRDTIAHNTPSWVLPSLSRCALYYRTYTVQCMSPFIKSSCRAVNQHSQWAVEH